MSRGLGVEQRRILQAMADHEDFQHYSTIMAGAWGWNDRLRKPVYWREDKENNLVPNYYQVFKRALKTLEKRGLIERKEQFSQFRKTPKLYFRLTDKGKCSVSTLNT
jgi:hypothetical protein